MHPFNDLHRVILVVLDGLRPDAIEAFHLLNLRRLLRTSASTLRGRSVTPSETWPSLTTLLTGVTPDVHGIVAGSLHLPRPKTELSPLPELLLRAGYPSSAFLGDLPLLHRVFAGRIAERLGFSSTRFAGANAGSVLFGARKTLITQRRGFVFMHWADADRAGHRHGWMSREYGEAARDLDAMLGTLAAWTDIENDPHTMIVALADHGGGGVSPCEHHEPHPLNSTIPMLFLRAGIMPRELGDVRLEDIPATIAWMLGAHLPEEYSGRILSEALESATEGVVAGSLLQAV